MHEDIDNRNHSKMQNEDSSSNSRIERIEDIISQAIKEEPPDLYSFDDAGNNDIDFEEAKLIAQSLCISANEPEHTLETVKQEETPLPTQHINEPCLTDFSYTASTVAAVGVKSEYAGDGLLTAVTDVGDPSSSQSTNTSDNADEEDDENVDTSDADYIPGEGDDSSDSSSVSDSDDIFFKFERQQRKRKNHQKQQHEEHIFTKPKQPRKSTFTGGVTTNNAGLSPSNKPAQSRIELKTDQILKLLPKLTPLNKQLIENAMLNPIKSAVGDVATQSAQTSKTIPSSAATTSKNRSLEDLQRFVKSTTLTKAFPQAVPRTLFRENTGNYVHMRLPNGQPVLALSSTPQNTRRVTTPNQTIGGVFKTTSQQEQPINYGLMDNPQSIIQQLRLVQPEFNHCKKTNTKQQGQRNMNASPSTLQSYVTTAQTGNHPPHSNPAVTLKNNNLQQLQQRKLVSLPPTTTTSRKNVPLAQNIYYVPDKGSLNVCGLSVPNTKPTPLVRHPCVSTNTGMAPWQQSSTTTTATTTAVKQAVFKYLDRNNTSVSSKPHPPPVLLGSSRDILTALAAQNLQSACISKPTKASNHTAFPATHLQHLQQPPPPTNNKPRPQQSTIQTQRQSPLFNVVQNCSTTPLIINRPNSANHQLTVFRNQVSAVSNGAYVIGVLPPPRASNKNPSLLTVGSRNTAAPTRILTSQQALFHQPLQPSPSVVLSVSQSTSRPISTTTSAQTYSIASFIKAKPTVPCDTNISSISQSFAPNTTTTSLSSAISDLSMKLSEVSTLLAKQSTTTDAGGGGSQNNNAMLSQIEDLMSVIKKDNAPSPRSPETATNQTVTAFDLTEDTNIPIVVTKRPSSNVPVSNKPFTKPATDQILPLTTTSQMINCRDPAARSAVKFVSASSQANVKPPPLANIFPVVAVNGKTNSKQNPRQGFVLLKAAGKPTYSQKHQQNILPVTINGRMNQQIQQGLMLLKAAGVNKMMNSQKNHQLEDMVTVPLSGTTVPLLRHLQPKPPAVMIAIPSSRNTHVVLPGQQQYTNSNIVPQSSGYTPGLQNPVPEIGQNTTIGSKTVAPKKFEGDLAELTQQIISKHLPTDYIPDCNLLNGGGAHYKQKTTTTPTYGSLQTSKTILPKCNVFNISSHSNGQRTCVLLKSNSQAFKSNVTPITADTSSKTRVSNEEQEKINHSTLSITLPTVDSRRDRVRNQSKITPSSKSFLVAPPPPRKKRRADDDDERHRFVPCSRDQHFLTLLGLEKCVHELNGEYFNFEKSTTFTASSTTNKQQGENGNFLKRNDESKIRDFQENSVVIKLDGPSESVVVQPVNSKTTVSAFDDTKESCEPLAEDADNCLVDTDKRLATTNEEDRGKYEHNTENNKRRADANETLSDTETISVDGDGDDITYFLSDLQSFLENRDELKGFRETDLQRLSLHPKLNPRVLLEKIV